MFKRYGQLYTVANALQKASATCSDAPVIFDAVIEKYPWSEII